MNDTVSPRIARAIAALPLRPDMVVLEIGCGPGVAARAVARLLTSGRILAIDRSAKAIAQARAGSATELATGRLAFRQCAIEQFVALPGEGPFDLVLAMRVGALDGRHPELETQAMAHIRAVLGPGGLLCIDEQAPVMARDIAGLP
ncbi:MAG: class I SAM-dependent methyltransferase [Devosia sp.]|uniref:class I SAM-dependent methyltransferase n=1 Tax=Devosia sp. TaxID=1871048 RepID=UPI0024C986C9|nr:class I SAM-dependent methyltransferase [Devosia sp.]UYN98682.1 MAG: class I SAM-dependent methyltransferase [Devosia sp.]